MRSLFIIIALFPVLSFASARVCVDHKNKGISVSSHIFFYGEQAFHTQAKPCVDEINRMFNNGTLIQLNKRGSWKKLKFNVSYSLISEVKAREIFFNRDPELNVIRIDTPPTTKYVDVSEHSLGGNHGYFLPSNGLGTSTTCAHEYAHGLGLAHPENLDFRGKGTPPIMAAGGSLVDPQFQYDPKAKAGGAGGTINKIHRKVSLKEMQDLNLGDLDYSWVTQDVECADLGKVTNRVYEKNGRFMKGLYNWNQ